MAENETDEDLDYNDEESEGSGFFRWLQVAVVLSALGGFFGLAWYAYKSGDNVDEKDVELVKVDKSPVKEAPANPGGMQIPNQDKTVYNLINGEKADKPVVERILPAAEEPIQHDGETGTWVNDKLKNKATGSTDAAKTDADSPVIKETPADVKNTEQFNPAKAKEAKAATAVEPVATQDTPVLAPDTKAVTVPAPVAEVKKEPAPAPAEKTAAEPAKEVAPAAETQQAPPQAATEEKPAAPAKLPKIRIQLEALQSEDEANKEWKRIVKKFPDELSGKQHYVVRVTVHGKTYYRLQAAPFDSSKEADALCMTLVSSDQGCILAK